MDLKTILTANGRDARLYLFLGIANWSLFLDHIPDNAVNWITARNYGFSGTADWFIFISGYLAAITYTNIILERGFIVGATRIMKRVWQLYAAYIVLFVIYIVTIGYVAQQYAAPDILDEFNVAGLIDHPIRILARGLLLQSKARNMDALQLYIVLMACFPPVLWLMLRKPDVAMVGSIALYFTARQFEWNLSSFPDGEWYFNPFCWQLLFVLGAWLALGEGARISSSILRSPALLCSAIACLVFALVMTIAGRFPELGNLFPRWLFDTFNPNDKENLASYRVWHLAVVVFMVMRFVPRDWRGLEWQIFQPAIKCGQQSLAVFCVGVFLSFAGHFALTISSGSLAAQTFVSATGIAIMTLVAYGIAWSRQQDSPLRIASIDAHS
jgi:hypothetical protein